MAAYDDLVARFGDSDTQELQIQVAKALLFQGVTQGRRDESEAALAAYEDLVARFGDSDIPTIQHVIAIALVAMGITYVQRGEHDAAVTVWTTVGMRFGASDRLELQQPVAIASIGKGVVYGQRGEHEAALAAWDEVVGSYGTSDALELQQLVASALVYKGNQQIEIGRAREAVHTSDELERRFGGFTDNESGAVAIWRWRAMWMKTHALLVQGQHSAALGAFQSICAMFSRGNETMLREMLAGVPILITAGASERQLVKILSAEKEAADALAPLVVALRLLVGEPVRVPAEMLEVAGDVRKNIEEVKRRLAGRGDG